MTDDPIATNRPSLYTGRGSYRHHFWDQQHCLKCGKWECAPESDDCDMSDEDYEKFVKEHSSWRVVR